MSTHTAARRTRYLQFGVPAAVLGTLSGALAAAPAQAETTPSIERPHSLPARTVPTEAPPATYAVQPGDTVFSIATRFGLRTEDVLTWNALTWRSVIYPGQTLSLSGTAAPAPAAAAPVAAPAPAASASTHVVVAGDTIFALAKAHGTTVDALLAANGLSRTSVIYPGQSLALSGSPAQAAAPSAAPAPSAPAPASPGARTHTVAAGETLFSIAQKYGTSTSTLFALNGLGSDAIIYPGQNIVVAAAPAPAPAPAAAPAAPPAQSFATLDAEQAANAALIVAIGRQLGVGDRAIAIALATAMVESSMRNLPWGDRDSLGLFQQRPSTGWGTPEQALDADRSIRVFFGGAGDPNGQATRGLLDIPQWEGMRFTDAAQAVQISAYPERYGQWETQAYQWLSQHG